MSISLVDKSTGAIQTDNSHKLQSYIFSELLWKGWLGSCLHSQAHYCSLLKQLITTTTILPLIPTYIHTANLIYTPLRGSKFSQVLSATPSQAWKMGTVSRQGPSGSLFPTFCCLVLLSFLLDGRHLAVGFIFPFALLLHPLDFSWWHVPLYSLGSILTIVWVIFKLLSKTQVKLTPVYYEL